MKHLSLILLGIFITISIKAQNYIIINPSIDNTIYESTAGNLSNGLGELLLCGKNANNQKRRILIKFDLSFIPANSIVSNLNLDVRGILGNTMYPISIHRLTKDWGEGNSNAGYPGNSGTNATTNDATWTQNLFGSSNWTSPGGDFVSIASDTTTSIGNSGPIHFNSQQFINDLQFFIDNPSQNFGWIIIGDESNTNTINGFHSRQSSISQLYPELAITYSSTTGILESQKSKITFHSNPVNDQLVLLSESWNFSSLTYSVIDLKGSLVKKGKIKTNIIPVSDLKEGIYFLQLITENGAAENLKFVKN